LSYSVCYRAFILRLCQILQFVPTKIARFHIVVGGLIAPPSQYQQSYAKFEPQIDEVLDEIDCKMYLEMPNNEKSDVVRLWG
jgi:hypothetical protein